mgnify:CR=1 FL=1
MRVVEHSSCTICKTTQQSVLKHKQADLETFEALPPINQLTLFGTHRAEPDIRLTPRLEVFLLRRDANELLTQGLHCLTASLRPVMAWRNNTTHSANVDPVVVVTTMVFVSN